jgi:hypothetical protein
MASCNNNRSPLGLKLTLGVGGNVSIVWKERMDADVMVMAFVVVG